VGKFFYVGLGPPGEFRKLFVPRVVRIFGVGRLYVWTCCVFLPPLCGGMFFFLSFVRCGLMEVKVEWELNDVERVVVEVLEPFGCI